jgi:hypothetical protein
MSINYVCIIIYSAYLYEEGNVSVSFYFLNLYKTEHGTGDENRCPMSQQIAVSRVRVSVNSMFSAKFYFSQIRFIEHGNHVALPRV